MKTISRIRRKSQGIEKLYKHKSVLFIPSESYDAATITVIQGLEELGFTIYTYKRPNINSWFCNEVVERVPDKLDFVISNMHWGTQWHLYGELKLWRYPKVLIDGCDNRGHRTWHDKYEFYCDKYKGKTRPEEAALMKDIQTYRWMEPLYGYKPDVIFTSQKNPGDKTIYLPFGIHREYFKLLEGRSGQDRWIDYAHFPGPGDKRKELTSFLKTNNLPGRVHNEESRGSTVIPSNIEDLVHADNNVHSYHRWILYKDYFRVLNDTKVLLYPGVYGRPHWDSMRPWEALASGCLVMIENPPIDMTAYPMTELCPFAVYKDFGDMIDRCRRLYGNQGWLEQLRLDAVQAALRHFTPLPIAMYFLYRLAGKS